ncbi:hypothetical protein BH10PSE19_BH10PSE19_13150 [soil metagenome]
MKAPATLQQTRGHHVMYAIDTLKVAKRLEQVGFTQEQAETQAELLAEVIIDNVPTLADLQQVERNLQQVTQNGFATIEKESASQKHAITNFKQETKDQFTAVRYEMEAGFTAVKHKFTAVSQEMKDEFTAVRQEMKDEFTAVRQEMKDEFTAVRQEMKDEFTAVRQEMKDEFTAVRQEMKDEFAVVRQELTHMATKKELKEEVAFVRQEIRDLANTMKWMGGFALAYFSILLAVFNFIKH